MMDEADVFQMRNEYTDWMRSVGHTEQYIQNDAYYRIMTTILDGRRE